jgi:hypothetical protein
MVESVEVKFAPCIARAFGELRISYQLQAAFRAFNQPKKAKRS